MKKLISVMLAGAMILGACACNKTESRKDKKAKNDDDESEISQTVPDESPEIGSDEYFQSIQYYLDPTNEAEVTKILDALYAGEPKLGDDNDTVYSKVVGAFGTDPINASMYANGNTYNFEFGWDTNPDYLDGKDRLVYFGYWNYDTEGNGELFSNETVIGYEKSYINPTRPGAGDFLLWVFSEDEAKAAYDIISKYLTNVYAEYNPEIVENSLMGYQLKCGEGGLEYYAYVRILHDEETNIWQVYTEVFFADPELIAVSAVDDTETTEVSDTSESEEISEIEDATEAEDEVA